MSALVKIQCKNIRSRKFPNERCKYTSSEEYCSRHKKHPQPFITTIIHPLATRSLQVNARKIQVWWKRLFTHKLLKEKSPAFFDRSLCHNTTDLASLEPLTEVPRDYFFVIRESGRLWGFDLRTLVAQYESDGRLENPYTKESCPPETVEHFRKSVDCLRKWKLPVQYESVSGLTTTQSWNLRVLDLCLRLDMLGYRVSTNWFSDLTIVGHQELYIELYYLWTEDLKLKDEDKTRLVPNHLTPDFLLFKWSPQKASKKYELDSLRRTNLNIFERLISSATEQSDKTLGAMYCVMALSRVSGRCRQAYPWLSA
jgi:hypothetical protein